MNLSDKLLRCGIALFILFWGSILSSGAASAASNVDASIVWSPTLEEFFVVTNEPRKTSGADQSSRAREMAMDKCKNHRSKPRDCQEAVGMVPYPLHSAAYASRCAAVMRYDRAKDSWRHFAGGMDMQQLKGESADRRFYLVARDDTRGSAIRYVKEVCRRAGMENCILVLTTCNDGIPSFKEPFVIND